MSERIRKAAGAILAAAALILALLPVLPLREPDGQHYRASGGRAWTLKETWTERNGSLRINEADRAALESLYGIGPAYAEKILEERQTNGPFYYAEDLLAVKGIGPQTLRGIRPMIDMTINESGE